MKLLILKLSLVFGAICVLSGLSFFYMMGGTEFNDRERVLCGIVDLQIAGLRLVAGKLQSMDEVQRSAWLIEQSRAWRGTLAICNTADLPVSEAAELRSADGSLCQYQDGFVQYITVPIDTTHCLRLGPVADIYVGQLEDEARATLELLVSEATDPGTSEEELRQLAARCRLPLQFRSHQSLPASVRERLQQPANHVMFREQGDFLIASSVPGRDFVLCTGALTKIRDTVVRLTRELIFAHLLMSSAAVAIFLILADRGLKKVEQAARMFATGDLSIRADESSSESASLARAFNFMASRTAASMQAKTELLQLVSHELRTPLARLRFAIELLESSGSAQENGQRMETIHHSVDDLEDIVGEVLEYVGNGTTTVMKSQGWLDIPSVLQAFKASFADNSGSVEIAWCTAGPNFTDQVFADRRAFQHVLRNLISNSWRFARTRIRVSAERAVRFPAADVIDKDSVRRSQRPVPGVNCVCVTVEDDGPGIPHGSEGEILAPLAQVADVQRSPRMHGGYGLGLAIVKRQVERHGGWLQIDRGDLGGCRVRTWWPDENLAEQAGV